MLDDGSEVKGVVKNLNSDQTILVQIVQDDKEADKVSDPDCQSFTKDKVRTNFR
jgi:hypothetical protein